MSPHPFAEVYEKLKELRRRGELTIQAIQGGGIESGMSEVCERLRFFDSVQYDSNHCLALLIERAKAIAEARKASDRTGCLIRMLEIQALAVRIFGDEEKAEAWLNRANRSFSGQKPIDLVDDELGTAVVREALEQVDHGMFA